MSLGSLVDYGILGYEILDIEAVGGMGAVLVRGVVEFIMDLHFSGGRFNDKIPNM